MEILASQVRHGTFFKRNGSVFHVMSGYDGTLTSEYDGAQYRMTSAGNYVFVMVGSADKIAQYLNKCGFTRVPLEISGFDVNRLMGRINGKYFVMAMFPVDGSDPYLDSRRVVSGITVGLDRVRQLTHAEALLIYRMWTEPEQRFYVVDTSVNNGILSFTIDE